MPDNTKNAQPAAVLPSAQLEKVHDVKAQEYLVRFMLGAVISVGAGLLSKMVGVRFAGAFLAFPAILPASLTLIQDKEGTRRADRNAIGAILGGVALVAFATIGEAAFVHIPPFVTLALAFGGWVFASLGLYALLAFLRPDMCDTRQD